jgi:hypothetical protein
MADTGILTWRRFVESNWDPHSKAGEDHLLITWVSADDGPTVGLGAAQVRIAYP